MANEAGGKHENSWISGAIDGISKAIEKLYQITPPDQHEFISLLLVFISLLVLVAAISPFAIGIYRFFRSYIKARHKHAKYRIENPGAFAWGNMILRAPLIMVGTEIYCFAQLSNKGKLLRYLKVAAVVIPVMWTALGMTIFVVTSKKNFGSLDVYISAIPVVLVCATVLVLDLSIVSDQGGIVLKVSRALLACITGYVLSSIPLNYYFKSSIDAQLAKADTERVLVENQFDTKLTSIRSEPWYLIRNGLTKNIERLQQELADERMGFGVTKTKNGTGINPKYREIAAELSAAKNTLAAFEKSNAASLSRLESLQKERQEKVAVFTDGNSRNHIKQHNALWSYAFSSIGSAFYFLGVLAIFWMVDTLAVLTSLIQEPEYEALLRKSTKSVADHFDAQSFDTQFFPLISDSGDA